MKIDRFYNPQRNTLLLASDLINLLKTENEMDVDLVFSTISSKYNHPTIDLLFESLGLLYLTDKIELNIDRNVLVLK